MATKDTDFIEFIIKALVDKPDEVKVERTVDEMGVLLKLTVNPEDMGKIIGREGKTAKALRTLLRVLGAKENARINFKIVEPEGSEKRAEKSEVKEEPKEEPKEEVKDTTDLPKLEV